MASKGRVPGTHGLGMKAEEPGKRELHKRNQRCGPVEQAKDVTPALRDDQFKLIRANSVGWLDEQDAHSLYIVTDAPIGYPMRSIVRAAHTYIVAGGERLLHGNREDRKIVPGEKDIEPYMRLIDTFPYETIVDPCMGSGSIGIAALRLGRKYIGIEVSPERFEYARWRISSIK